MVGLTVAVLVLNVLTVIGLVLSVHYAREAERDATEANEYLLAAVHLLERIADAPR